MTLLNLLVIGLLISSANSSNEGNCAYVRIKEQPQQFAVQIKASPDVVKLGLTKTASLRCSGAPDSGDVQSITISRRGSKIATVTTTLAAYIMDASTDVQTTGQVAEAPPGQSFIELTWQLPSKPQLQKLACQITALDSEGQEVSSIKAFSFAFSQPTVMDVVKYVQELETEKDAEIQKQKNITDKQIAEMDWNNKAQDQNNKAEIEALKIQDHTNKVEIVDNKAEIAALKTQDQINKAEIVTLKSQNHDQDLKLAESRHIESGILDMGALGSGNPQSRTKSVTFKFPYNSDPIVHLALLDEDTNVNYSAYYEVTLIKSDTKGFTVEFRLERSDSHIIRLKLSWLAFP